MKNCKNCLIAFDLSHFYPKKGGKFGVGSICKVCDRKRSKETGKIYYQKNKEKIDLKNKNWVINNPEKATKIERNRYYKHREKLLLKNTIYRKANPHIFSARSNKRRCAKLQRTPKWLNKNHFNEIKEIYKKAKELQKLDGIKRHVDHIVPLQGKTVCGLHVPWNLQVITKIENSKKSNKLIQEMIYDYN